MKPQDPESAVEEKPLNRLVALQHTIDLFEDDRVVNVTPFVTAEQSGSYLVADLREAQVREYDADGSLIRYFGRRGQGPGEFRYPVSAFRLPTGGLAVAELNGTITLFNSTADSVVRTIRAPVTPLYNAQVVGTDSILIAGRSNTGENPTLLHIRNLAGDQTKDFFTAPIVDPQLQSIARAAGTSHAAIWGDTVAAVFSFSDTLYLFDMHGRNLSQLQIPFENFRPLRTTAAPRSPEELNQELIGVTQVRNVFRLPDGVFLVQTAETVSRAEEEYALIAFTSDGRRLQESYNTPQLLAVNPASGKLVFLSPAASAPNQWIIARWLASPS